MPRKKYERINVPMVKTRDPEDRFVVDSLGIQSTFDPQGTLTFNGNNGILTWNSGDITHVNFTSDDFTIMFDAESGIIIMTAGEKNIYYNIDALKELIQKQGYTIEEMEKILAEEKGDEKDERRNEQED